MTGGATEQKAAALANAPGNAGMKEGLEALNLLAHSVRRRLTSLSWKIAAQRFVADDPPQALVDRMAKTRFISSGGGTLRRCWQTLVARSGVQLEEVFPQQGEELPMEFLASAYRTTLTRSVESRRPG